MKILRFTEALKSDPDYDTIPFDVGMKARFVGERFIDKDLLEVFLDWSEFTFENSQLMIANWPDHKNKAKLKWNQTAFYPKDHKTSIIVKDGQFPYEVVQDE